MQTLKERVSAGIQFLNEVNPGWKDRINLEELDLKSECGCILGQLYGDYFDGIVALFHEEEEQAIQYGLQSYFAMQFEGRFGEGDYNEDYEEMTREWKEQLGCV